MTWNAVEFEHWFNALTDPAKRQRALDDLTAAQRKERRELRTFIQFASAVKLDADPRTIQNRTAPEPDIFCEISGCDRYFELGELTEESIPKSEADARRAGLDTYGGAISPTRPVEKMVFEKCRKTYASRGVPVDLLLHFSVGHQVPHPGVLSAWLAESRDRVMAALNAGPFGAIWFFDCWTARVLGVIERGTQELHL